MIYPMVKIKTDMKILYGVQLNGNGHITRSIEVINNLKMKGHQVDVITSGTKSTINIEKIKSYKGLNLYYKKSGSINWIKTILKSNIIRLIKDIKPIKGYDLIISDFEPITAWSSKISNIKSIGISNQCGIDNSLMRGFTLSKAFIKYFAPCDDYINITYFGENQTIISGEIQKSKIETSDFFIIYLPNIEVNRIIEILSSNKFKWKIYTNDINCYNSSDNIKVIKINKENFIKDITTCKGVITQSGFSTTSECLFLCKKLWSIPIKGHYEQIYNSKELNKVGIFTEDFNKESLKKWINDDSIIVYDWINPMNNIIKKIENNK